ncbi:putative transposase [Marivirga sericea]|uniref:Putative transposase n=1 Tax=Marivirga sericea TaxID=1028 RepID=A0A1X7KPF3_9BACT|nr:helix-turn-helix domain-containing protein [Marivirga sericea]SMG42607.1 putative transposase [Marivirga sericea]
MASISIEVNSLICFNNENYLVKRISDLDSIIGERTSDLKKIRIPINEIKSPIIEGDIDTSPTAAYSEEEWEMARRRFEIIEPFLQLTNRASQINESSEEHGIHPSTIYRWLERYESSGLISSLVPYQKDGGRGKGRISEKLEPLIQDIIENQYLRSQRINISQAYIELQLACRNENLEAPHINTFRKRVKAISLEIRTKNRDGKKNAQEKFEPIRGLYNKATYPLSIVQIDHTLLDIILVDNETRRPIGRPWITVAIDVYSRMITGFYVSYDPPSSMSVGLCLSHSILPKEKYLLNLGIEGEWPCWGIMNTVHADNAKEFKGRVLKRACEEYKINIQWRPIGTPHWGGHIERLIGSLNGVLHTLPGTTFSKKEYRENYNSEDKATLSLIELEKYLSMYIVDIYHKKVHSGLKVSPMFKYTEGLLGSGSFGGYGLPAKVSDEDKLKKDFMPFFERTVQRYGVKIDQIYYYHDILRRWVNSNDPKIPSQKRKFIFCRDPRDISIIYFLDPETRNYYSIPCRDITRPSVNIWEFRDAIKHLKDQGAKSIDEDKIFDAYERLNNLKEESKIKTKHKKRRTKEGRTNVHESIKKIQSENLDTIDELDIKPFDDIDYGSY